MQPRPQNRAPERLSQVFVTIQLFYTAVFHTGVLPVSYTPNGCDSMQMSPTGVFLTCPCRCLFYRFAPMQVCATQVFFREGLPIWVGPEQECLIPPCLHASCVSAPVRSYRRHRNPRGSFLLHFRASAPLSFPHYRIGFPLQVRTRRGPTSRLAPPPHLFQVHKPEVRSPPR